MVLSFVDWNNYEEFFLKQFVVVLCFGTLLAIIASLPRVPSLSRHCEFAFYGLLLGLIATVIPLGITGEVLRQEGMLIPMWNRSGKLLKWMLVISPLTGSIAGFICGMLLARTTLGRSAR